MKTAMRARLKKCVACGQAKPLTEYANHSHRHCSACYDFSGVGQSHTEREARRIVDMLRRKSSRPVRNSTSSDIYTAPELRQVVRPGADDHERYPSRIGNTRRYRNGSTEICE